MLIARTMCGLTHVTVGASCTSCSLLCTWTVTEQQRTKLDDQWVLTVNEETHWRDLSLIQFSCNCSYSPITHNKTPVHWIWGLLSVRPARLPVLTWVPSSVDSWNNIQGTFPTGSAPDTTPQQTLTYSTKPDLPSCLVGHTSVSRILFCGTLSQVSDADGCVFRRLALLTVHWLCVPLSQPGLSLQPTI